MQRFARLLTLLLAGLLVANGALAGSPKLISGTYSKGHNVTEPRPEESRYLRTTEGGVVIIGTDAGFYLSVDVKERPEQEMYIRITYEVPEGVAPQSNDMIFNPTSDAFNLSSPDFVRGLKVYSDYKITVEVFSSKDSQNPVDTLVQKVRSYVDTTGASAKLMKGMKAR